MMTGSIFIFFDSSYIVYSIILKISLQKYELLFNFPTFYTFNLKKHKFAKFTA